ncbi:MAG: hypothetical protein Q8R28_06535 [Dehalococcoidia bacterium]|nr:hypothetical protein [Dehalococcoidia bacterium]
MKIRGAVRPAVATTCLYADIHSDAGPIFGDPPTGLGAAERLENTGAFGQPDAGSGIGHTSAGFGRSQESGCRTRPDGATLSGIAVARSFDPDPEQDSARAGEWCCPNGNTATNANRDRTLIGISEASQGT